MNKSWISNTIFALGILLLLVVANLNILVAFFAPVPLSYNNIPFPLSSREYGPNDQIVIYIAQCSEEDVPISVVSVRELYNPVTGALYPLPPGTRIVPPGCTNATSMMRNLLPEDLEEGQYVIRGVTTFRGKFKTVDVAWQTQTFIYHKE